MHSDFTEVGKRLKLNLLWLSGSVTPFTFKSSFEVEAEEGSNLRGTGIGGMSGIFWVFSSGSVVKTKTHTRRGISHAASRWIFSNRLGSEIEIESNLRGSGLTEESSVSSSSSFPVWTQTLLRSDRKKWSHTCLRLWNVTNNSWWMGLLMAHVTMVILTVQIQAVFHWQFLWFRRWCFSIDWKIEEMILIIGPLTKKHK